MVDINSPIARALKKSSLRPVAIVGYRTMVRLTHRSTAPALMVNTLASGGTHLIMSLVDAFDDYQFLGRHFAANERDLQEPRRADTLMKFQRELNRLRTGFYMTGHLAYHELIQAKMDDRRIKRVHVVRDPRAILVSRAMHVRSHQGYQPFASMVRRFPTMDQLLRAMVDGFDQDHGYGAPFNDGLLAFLPWLQDPEGVVLRFEDLIGPSGGGSHQAQLESAQILMTHVGIAVDEQLVERATSAAFDARAATFRSGRIDGWRDYLSGDLLDYLENATRSTGMELGYQY